MHIVFSYFLLILFLLNISLIMSWSLESSHDFESFKECQALAYCFLSTDPKNADESTRMIIDIVDTMLATIIENRRKKNDYVRKQAAKLLSMVSVFYVKMNVAAGIKHVTQNRFSLPNNDPLVVSCQF